ncbi:MAG: hypothetical protein IKU45_03545 [Clostridia bacterium]|nr:hypothetical protein [Clostridia bacterium]
MSNKNNNKKGCGCSWIIWVIIAIIVVSVIAGGSDNSDDGKEIDGNIFDSINDQYGNPDISENTGDTGDSTNTNDTNNNNNNDDSNYGGDAYTPENTNTPKYKTPSNSDIYYQLTNKQREIYHQLLEGVKKGELNFTFNGATLDDVSYAYQTVFLGMHPEFFWLDGAFNYRERSNNITVTLKTYNYWTYTTNPNKYINELNAKIEQILAKARTYPTTYEKVKFVHDYLIQNIEYDYDALKELNSTFKSTSTEHALSIYGALVNGKTLCGGYSESFYTLMNALGIECYYIKGYAGEYHAWNYLKIDGQYYYMDVTWDDKPLPDSNGKPVYPHNVTYDYFCLTSDEIERNHTPDSDVKTPDAHATLNSYFVKEGLVFSSYNYSETASALLKQQGNSALFIKYTTKEAFQAAYTDLITNKKIWDTNAITTKQYWYVSDEDIYTIMFIPNNG